MATISPTTITDTVRPGTVNVTIEAIGDLAEIITSVSATIDANEPSIRITPGVTSVSIVGSYKDAFEDLLTYIERGSSNLIEIPKVANGISNLPPNKDFYQLDQDQRGFVRRTYTVTVNFQTGDPETFTLTHDILNSLDGITSFVSSYYN
jgi:hypothetical protein